MNYAETIKYLRAQAKKHDLTFRQMKNVTLNGSPAYEFVDRFSGVPIVTRCTLSSALENWESGYVSECDLKLLEQFLENWIIFN